MFKMRLKKYTAIAVLCSFTALMSSCGKADDAYKNATEYLNEGKYDEAIKSFKSAIKENSDRAEYYIGYGMALNYTGQYDAALDEFDKAVQDVENKISKQNNKQLYYGKAIAYYGLNDYNNAVEVCDDAIKINQAKDLNYDINLLKAASLQLLGDINGAEKTYSDIINDSSNAEAYLRRGDLYSQSGDYDNACKDYENAIKKDSKCYDAYFGIYKAYHSQNNEQKADEALEKVISLDGNNKEELMQKGRAYIYKKDYDKASSKLDLAVKNGNISAIYYQGMIKMEMNDYDGAIELFEKYLKESSVVNIPEVYNQLAGCYIEKGDFDNAQTIITKGIKSANTSIAGLLRKNQVILYEKTGDFKSAKKEAEKYIKAYPADDGMAKELKFIKTRITAQKKAGK